MNKIKIYFGKFLYIFCKRMPLSNSKFSFGSKFFRKICGKLILKNCGKNVNIEKNASLSNNISLGDYSGLGVNCKIYGSCDIGKYVMMGPDCVILAKNHIYDDISKPMYFQGMTESKKVTIEDDVWIGQRVIIMPGITIHKGSIIAAGAVVTKDVPEYTIVGGVPAKIIKYRKK